MSNIKIGSQVLVSDLLNGKVMNTRIETVTGIEIDLACPYGGVYPIFVAFGDEDYWIRADGTDVDNTIKITALPERNKSKKTQSPSCVEHAAYDFFLFSNLVNDIVIIPNKFNSTYDQTFDVVLKYYDMYSLTKDDESISRYELMERYISGNAELKQDLLEINE